MNYDQSEYGKEHYPIKGKLKRVNATGIETGKVTIIGVGVRSKFKDDEGKIFVKAFGKWWKFPEQVEY